MACPGCHGSAFRNPLGAGVSLISPTGPNPAPWAQKSPHACANEVGISHADCGPASRAKEVSGRTVCRLTVCDGYTYRCTWCIMHEA